MSDRLRGKLTSILKVEDHFQSAEVEINDSNPKDMFFDIRRIFPTDGRTNVNFVDTG